MNQLNLTIKQNTWAIILGAIVTSFFLPQLGISLQPYLNYLLMTMMFLSCLDLRAKEIIRSLTDFRSIIYTLAIVSLASPLIVFFLKDYFPDPIFLGLVIAATIPSGRSSAFLCNIYGGIPIKALVASSISNIISPFTVPLIVYLLAHTTIKINPLEMGTTIFYMVIIPLILAVIISKTKAGQKLNTYSSGISVIILFLIIIGIISPIKNVVFQNPELTLTLSLLVTVLIIIDFSLGFHLGKNHSENVTYAITSSYKNYTLATLLSLTLFTPLVALPSIVYTVISNLLLIPLQLITTPHHLHRHRKHQNILFFSAGLIIALIFSRSQLFQLFLKTISPFPLLSAFIAGMLFASTFTLAIGGLILINLANLNHTLAIILFSGLGAVFCDYLIFKFFKNKIFKEISPIYDEIITKSHLKKIIHTRYFAWTLPVIGALIIASPLPDELGVSLLGISRMKSPVFFLISLISHLVGISGLFFGSRLF